MATTSTKASGRRPPALFSRDGTYEFGQSGVYIGTAHVERALSLMGPPGLEPGQLNNYVMAQPIINISDGQPHREGALAQ